MRSLLFLILSFLICAAPVGAQEVRALSSGDPFPEISLPTPASAADRLYLGLPEADSFTPSEVSGAVLLVELLNVHCPHCKMQTAHYNKLFTLIDANPKTQGQIKLLGLAIGNLPDEVQTFRENFKVPFPIIADPRFEAYRAIGGGATPFSLYVRQADSGQPGLVTSTHLGMNQDVEKIYGELQRLAEENMQSLEEKGAAATQVRRTIAPLFSETELQTKVRNAMIATGGSIMDFSSVDISSGRRIYTALMQVGEERQRIFAEVTSRSSVCDICHDVHFIYVFDSSGKIIGFTPLHLTKYGNVEWSEQDVEQMRQRVVGRFLSAPKSYDPKVDAVTSATMTSAIIFDSLAQGEALLQELSEKGLR